MIAALAMTSAHLLAKLRRLHEHIHDKHGHSHGYEEHHSHHSHHNHYGSDLDKPHFNAQINIENNADKHYSNANFGHNDFHGRDTPMGPSHFQSSQFNKREQMQQSYTGGAVGPNSGYSSFQGSQVRDENNFQYASSKYPMNYGFNTKYDSLNLNPPRMWNDTKWMTKCKIDEYVNNNNSE